MRVLSVTFKNLMTFYKNHVDILLITDKKMLPSNFSHQTTCPFHDSSSENTNKKFTDRLNNSNSSGNS
ncbi:hypothetical protein LMG9446_1934 [Lactococcus lactis subsp. lactis]|nr:hypothetical protein LMG9446_1934 [Lactococcus lactis subsp. lactis]